MWIITSPMCDEVDALKYRFNKVVFNASPHLIYKVYIQGTIEETKLLQSKPNRFTSVTIKTINAECYDENSYGIVCQ